MFSFLFGSFCGRVRGGAFFKKHLPVELMLFIFRIYQPSTKVSTILERSLSNTLDCFWYWEARSLL